MRIGNRTGMRITNARLTRQAKERAWAAGGTGKVYTSRLKKTQKSGNLTPLEMLKGINKSQTTAPGQLVVQNQQKLYSYQTMKTAADRVDGHLEQFLGDGENSLFGQADGEAAKTKAVSEVTAFVSDYNVMIGKLTQSGDRVEKAYADKMKSLIGRKTASLKALGITVERDGTLSLSTKTLAAADLADIRGVFGKEGGLADQMKTQAKAVSDYAKEKMADLEKSNTYLSSNYNQYGTSSNLFESFLSRYYNAKG